MTTRRLNYTNCKRIRRADVHMRLASAPGLSCEVIYDLSSYDFPPDAEVVLEAAVDWTVMRFPLGTVSSTETQDRAALTEFETAEGLFFRLKVLGTDDESGLILGQADHLRPAEDTPSPQSRSFVAVRPADLGDVVWQLSFDEEQPILLLNEKLGDWQSFLRRQFIVSLLMPEVLRQVLRQAASDVEDDADEGSWQEQALQSVVIAGGPPHPDLSDEDAVELWIDDAVRRFTVHHRLWSGVRSMLGAEDSE